MTEHKITPQPEYDALNAFDAENNVEPARTIAERIVWDCDVDPTHFLVGALTDAIAHAIEDARDLGQRRAPFIPRSRYQ